MRGELDWLGKVRLTRREFLGLIPEKLSSLRRHVRWAIQHGGMSTALQSRLLETNRVGPPSLPSCSAGRDKR